MTFPRAFFASFFINKSHSSASWGIFLPAELSPSRRGYRGAQRPESLLSVVVSSSSLTQPFSKEDIWANAQAVYSPRR